MVVSYHVGAGNTPSPLEEQQVLLITFSQFSRTDHSPPYFFFYFVVLGIESL